LDAFKEEKVEPPKDVHNVAGWNEYWKSALLDGSEREAADRLASDPALPALLQRRGVKTILCAGNGLSQEAPALALHGFDVVALDISPMVATYSRLSLNEQGHALRHIPGFSMGDDGIVRFETKGPVDPKLCPAIHLSDEFAPPGGGSLMFVTGDLSLKSVCPGPFDAVIERRTLQLFREADQLSSLERLVGRLATPGTFVSQEHRPGKGPDFVNPHFAEDWLTEHGFARYNARRLEVNDAAPRLAYLMNTFG